MKTSRFQLASGTVMDADLRISELGFALGLAEVTRQPAWRLTASENPWEVQYAFDNSLTSWWTSGRYVNRNIFIEVDFGRDVELDRILVSQNEDQRWISLRPQALVDGRWISLHARESDVREPPRTTLRREVRDEMKYMNIH
jgi:hypothetical protein